MGKITVKHYLNKKLKPDIEPDGNYYPLYVSLTVNKKNIRQRSNIDIMISELDFENRTKGYSKYSDLMEYEVNLFQRITERLLNDIAERKVNVSIMNSRFNKGNSKDEFTNMMNVYINYYSSSIFLPVSTYSYQYIRNEVFDKLESTFKVSDGIDIRKVFKFDFPYKIEDFIFENLSKKSFELYNMVESLRKFLASYSNITAYDIPLIDWLDFRIQPILIDFFKTNMKTPFSARDIALTDLLIESYISEIDNIVKNNYIELYEKTFVDGIQHLVL